MDGLYGEKFGVRSPEMGSHYTAALEFLHLHRYWVALILAISVIGSSKVYSSVSKKLRIYGANFPPVVKLTNDQIFNDPINSYNNAIREHGDIIAVKKKDKMEIMVSEKYAQRVLTDEKNFSFEHGVADAMNMEFLMNMTQGRVFKTMADVTSGLLGKRMDIVVKQVSSIFFDRAEEITNDPKSQALDLFEYTQSTVSDAMVVLLLGKKFLNPAYSHAVKMAANDVAELGGIFQNRSYFARTFPALWRFTTAIKTTFWRLGVCLFMFMGRPIWRETNRLLKDPQTYVEEKEITLLLLLVRKFATPERTLKLADRGMIYLVLMSTMFASVHQVASTMVWVLCELALRPQDQEEIYAEIKSIMDKGPENLTHDDLLRAVHTDSFLREVMRTKGDTFSTVRMAMNDVPLGKYVIPKGYTVHPNAALAHNAPENAGDNPETFDGKRWIGGKPASMAGPGHLAFGLGRWACPGRYFAVAEIKMMVFSILVNSKVELVNNKYEIVDKLMIASAPPEAVFKLTKRPE
ncbi:cytochrome P450 [Penicillium chermesinum]|uniref:Cytochrome P450 n=1 Tax=Penicillium chermesinum TaxID=63820 RepID=A0A9W9PNC3_9EURO|nr:cytochrome P450 [Penicillium chermesinum]KAJ5249009.1 cytochrome P450 [Penicillium chermesinum]